MYSRIRQWVFQDMQAYWLQFYEITDLFRIMTVEQSFRYCFQKYVFTRITCLPPRYLFREKSIEICQSHTHTWMKSSFHLFNTSDVNFKNVSFTLKKNIYYSLFHNFLLFLIATWKKKKFRMNMVDSVLPKHYCF